MSVGAVILRDVQPQGRNLSENSGSGNAHKTKQYLNSTNQFSINNVSSYMLPTL